jgi:predicted acylesterase/phospholipase RssA
MAEETSRLGLVLSGGGARGPFQIGVFERLRQHPRYRDRPLALSGTSAGAINAALIASGKTPDEMTEFWEDLATDPPVEATSGLIESIVRVAAGLTLTESVNWAGTRDAWGFFLSRAIERFPPWPGRLLGAGIEYLLTQRFDLVSRFIEDVETPSLVNASRLRERLVDAFGETIRSEEHDLAISAVDVDTGKVVRFVSRETPLTRSPEYVVAKKGITVDMVLASASIPVLFPPAVVGERRLWDGGLLVNTPLATVVALEAREVIPVLVTELAAPEPPLDRLGGALERAVDPLRESSYDTDRKLLLERNRLAQMGVEGYQQVKLYRPIRPDDDPDLVIGAYLHFDPQVMRRLRASGRAAASRWLSIPDPEDRLE